MISTLGTRFFTFNFFCGVGLPNIISGRFLNLAFADFERYLGFLIRFLDLHVTGRDIGAVYGASIVTLTAF